MSIIKVSKQGYLSTCYPKDPNLIHVFKNILNKVITLLSTFFRPGLKEGLAGKFAVCCVCEFPNYECYPNV